jgi:signal transduction histidine kinase
MGTEPTPKAGEFANCCGGLIDHSRLPMAALAGAGHIVAHANPAFCRLLGKPLEQFIGTPFGELLPQGDNCVVLIDRVFRTGTAESFTGMADPKTLPVFWSYSAWPVLTPGGFTGVMIQMAETMELHSNTLAMNEGLLLGALRQHEFAEASEKMNAQLNLEITERKQVEASLLQAQAQLADRAGQLEHAVAERTTELISSNGQLEALVYSIAHDLRSPLRSMQGCSAMLLGDTDTVLSEKGRDFVNRINKSAQFMGDLLQDLLVFSGLAGQHIDLRVVEPESVVRAVISGLSQETQGRIEIAGPWLPVLAHEQTLGRVLKNLVSNALKFVAPDVPPLVRLRTGEKAGFIRFWVEDNGIGIEPRHQDQIFRLFTRLHGDRYEGTGIGLAIVQKGVERMGGNVGVESTPGRGSRFWFDLRKA